MHCMGCEGPADLHSVEFVQERKGNIVNKRTNDLVRKIQDAKDDVSLADLAELFGVSQRTIRNDLNEINDTLIRHKLEPIQLQSGGKLQVPEFFEQSIPLLVGGDFYTYKMSKEERKQIIAAMIVSSPEYITLADLADRLFVSRATVINDLKDVKALVQNADLEVLSHANKGLRIAGPESARRRFLLKLLSPSQHASQNVSAVSRFISVQAGDRATIQKIINEQEHVHKSYLTDISFHRILLYLGIMVERNTMGEFPEAQETADETRYSMAQDILKYVSQYCKVPVIEDDIRLLSNLLAKSRYMKQGMTQSNSVKVQMITRQFISAVSEELEINLNNDYEFFESLSHHLESVFSTPAAEYPEQDVILEILENNRETYDAVNKCFPVLQQYAGREISEMEKAYVVIHVCAALERQKHMEVAFHVIVACHAGIGTSRLLLEKLKQHFQFRIIDIISAHEADNLKKEDADFIISTVPLKNCAVDHVVVSPNFSDEDYVRVGTKIQTMQNSRFLPSRVEENEFSAKGLIEELDPIVRETVPEQAEELMKKIRRAVREYLHQPLEAEAEIFAPYLHHLLPASHIELDVECSDWKEAVRFCGSRLLERGYIEERYIDAMIANIEENGPYIVLSKGFALPHEGLELGSVKLGMYMIRLKNPVPFGAEELDPVEFVCCLSAVDHKMHLKAFFNLVNMLQNDKFKQMLHEAETPFEAARTIEKYEYSIME